jgi:hypothetical protein
MFPNISCVVHLVLFYFEVEGILIHTSSCHFEYLLNHFQLLIESLMFMYFHIYCVKLGCATCVNILQHLAKKGYMQTSFQHQFLKKKIQDPK